MTALLQQVIAKVEALPEDQQNFFASEWLGELESGMNFSRAPLTNWPGWRRQLSTRENFMAWRRWMNPLLDESFIKTTSSGVRTPTTTAFNSRN